MELQETIDALDSLIGYRIRFADGHEQDCVAIEATIFGNVFIDCGKIRSDGTRIGYYVMPRNIERVEREDEMLLLIGYEHNGTVARVHKMGERNAEETT